MGMKKVSGRTLTSEVRSFVQEIDNDPETEEIKVERKKPYKERLFPYQLTKAISVTPLGGGRFVCLISTLDCSQKIRIRTNNGGNLTEKAEQSDKNLRLRFGT